MRYSDSATGALLVALRRVFYIHASHCNEHKGKVKGGEREAGITQVDFAIFPMYFAKYLRNPPCRGN